MNRNYIYFLCILFLFCTLLAGCTVGEYKVADVYLDENGDQHFMGLGKSGPSGEENENSSNEVHNVKENEELIEIVSDMQENDFNSESIIGTSLKRGWTSSDHSILKGKNVSVKEDCTLFSIYLDQDKEVRITYDIMLDNGEYQLIYISPDNTEQVLQDGQIIQTEDKFMFTQGENKITVLSNDAIFKEINIQITGIETSDFE